MLAEDLIYDILSGEDEDVDCSQEVDGCTDDEIIKKIYHDSRGNDIYDESPFFDMATVTTPDTGAGTTCCGISQCGNACF